MLVPMEMVFFEAGDQQLNKFFTLKQNNRKKDGNSLNEADLLLLSRTFFAEIESKYL